MYTQQRIQKKTRSHSSASATETNLLGQHPAINEADLTVHSQNHQTPDLQTQLETAARFGHNFGQVSVQDTTPAVIQPKLAIGAPGDKYEQEADSVASQVMSMNASANQQSIQRQGTEAEEEEVQMKPLGSMITPLVQRQEEPEEELQAKPLLQRQAAPEDEELQMKPLGTSFNLVVQREPTAEDEEVGQMKPMNSSINLVQRKGRDSVSYGVDVSSPSGGESLPAPVLAKMENSLGADFSDVRVHRDGQAENLNAQAFAVGNNLHFAQGNYDPTSQSGQALIGHELAHVVQQREGRVSSPALAGDGNATVVQDPAMEAEADARGAQAAASPEVETRALQPAMTDVASNQVLQQKPVVQAALPALGALAAAGAKLSWTMAAEAATVGATLLAAGSSVNAGQSVQPGTSGVQSVQLDNGWMSNVDKQKLILITQYRLINRYVDRWIATHPETATANPEPAPAPKKTKTPAPAPTPAPEKTPAVTDAGGQVDTAIVEAVKAEVQLGLETELNNNQKAAPTKEFIWSDSGDSTADWVGTVGAIAFTDVKGSFLKEPLVLNTEAAKIPNLVPPMLGKVVEVRQFRGGRMNRSPQFSTGYGDDLAVNLDGSGPTYDQAANISHGSHTYSTAWNWDGNTTHLLVEIMIDGTGTPFIIETGREGTPRDYSGSRAMPWNWFG